MYRYGHMYETKGQFVKAPWLGKMVPFKVWGHTYFCGTYQASCHLIDTGDGLIMIDPGYKRTAYLVVDSIYQLGFNPRDIKYIVCTHWHGDHTEAVPNFVDLTGAKTLLGRQDVELAAKYFTPDILVDDGDTLTLGNVTLRFVHTPGHTPGTISIFYDDTDGQTTYRFGTFGGAGLNTLVPEDFEFEGCREAYFASLERLKKEPVDVFIGNHTWNNDTLGKYETLAATGKNEFIDSTLWGKFLDDYKVRLENIIAKEQA